MTVFLFAFQASIGKYTFHVVLLFIVHIRNAQSRIARARNVGREFYCRERSDRDSLYGPALPRIAPYSRKIPNPDHFLSRNDQGIKDSSLSLLESTQVRVNTMVSS